MGRRIVVVGGRGNCIVNGVMPLEVANIAERRSLAS